jgi:hypothetical protein
VSDSLHSILCSVCAKFYECVYVVQGPISAKKRARVGVKAPGIIPSYLREGAHADWCEGRRQSGAHWSWSA